MSLTRRIVFHVCDDIKFSKKNQAVGRCCLDGYEVHGVVWITPDTRKATGPRSSTCTHVLLLSYLTSALEKPEERDQKSRSTHRGAQGRGFDSPRGRSLFAFNLAIMKNSCAHSESVASNHCKIVAELL